LFVQLYGRATIVLKTSLVELKWKSF
jgi:hypothetical protein